jgi:hypothetical protein
MGGGNPPNGSESPACRTSAPCKYGENAQIMEATGSPGCPLGRQLQEDAMSRSEHEFLRRRHQAAVRRPPRKVVRTPSNEEKFLEATAFAQANME